MVGKYKILNGASLDRRVAKRPYSTPTLLLFGQVAALTQSASGICSADNTTCGAAGMVMMSDRNTKENIVQIGIHPLGLGLYLFDYKVEHRHQWGQDRQFGVIAQEVEALMPEAVCVHSDGYKMVDYGKLGIAHPLH